MNRYPIHFRIEGHQYHQYSLPKLHEADPIFRAMYKDNVLYDGPYDPRGVTIASINVHAVPPDRLRALVNDYLADASTGHFAHTAGALALALAFARSSTRDMLIRQAVEDNLSPTEFLVVFSKAYERQSVKLLSHLARASLRFDSAIFDHLPNTQADLLTEFRSRIRDTFARRLGDRFPVRRLDSFRDLLVGPRGPGNACTCAAFTLPGRQETRTVKSWVALYATVTINHLKESPSLKATRSAEALGSARLDAEMYCEACFKANFTSALGPVHLVHGSDFSSFISAYEVALEDIVDEEWAKMVPAGPAQY